VLSLVVFVVIFIACSDDLITRMGNLTVWSALICLTTIAFAVASVASAIVCLAHTCRGRPFWGAALLDVRHLGSAGRTGVLRLLGPHRPTHLGLTGQKRRRSLLHAGPRPAAQHRAVSSLFA
jgi:hypothetical protein